VKRQTGFTLIELTLCIVILGILAVTIASYSSRPLEAYVASTRRAELLNLADTALAALTRDLRTALPHSVRVSGTALEFLPVTAGGRYRLASSGAVGSNPLDFAMADAAFHVFGSQSGWPAGARLVIYHTGQTGANAWNGDSVISPASISFSLSAAGSETLVSLSSPHWFPFNSPQKRFYVVTRPISFVCNTGSGQLNRYSGYAMQASQPTNTAATPLSSAETDRVVDFVSACSFRYNPGSAQHSAVVTVDLTLTRDGESVRLLQQVHINNGA